MLGATSLLFALYVRDNPAGASPVPISKSNIMQVLRNREIWLVGVTYFALNGVIRGLLTWLPTFLVERMAMTLIMASIIGGLLSLPGIPTMFLGRWISDVRLCGRKNIVIAASLLAPIPILILLPLTQNTTFILVMIGSLFALLYSPIGLYFAYPSILLPKEQVGTASGFIDMLGSVGAFLGIFAIGFVVDAFKSYDPMFTLLATMSIFGAATILKVTS
jgi:sugar phosphate permease